MPDEMQETLISQMIIDPPLDGMKGLISYRCIENSI